MNLSRRHLLVSASALPLPLPVLASFGPPSVVSTLRGAKLDQLPGLLVDIVAIYYLMPGTTYVGRPDDLPSQVAFANDRLWLESWSLGDGFPSRTPCNAPTFIEYHVETGDILQAAWNWRDASGFKAHRKRWPGGLPAAMKSKLYWPVAA